MGRPSQEGRGLKLNYYDDGTNTYSRPSQEGRGLKPHSAHSMA